MTKVILDLTDNDIIQIVRQDLQKVLLHLHRRGNEPEVLEAVEKVLEYYGVEQ